MFVLNCFKTHELRIAGDVIVVKIKLYDLQTLVLSV